VAVATQRSPVGTGPRARPSATMWQLYEPRQTGRIYRSRNCAEKAQFSLRSKFQGTKRPDPPCNANRVDQRGFEVGTSGLGIWPTLYSRDIWAYNLGVAVCVCRGPPLRDGIVKTVESALSAGRALCICRVGKVAFSSAFARFGVDDGDFARLFEVRELDGKQSNLNRDLKRWLKAYPFVLYAFKDLRHVNPNLRKVSKLISGPNVNDVVARFLDIVSGQPQSLPVARATPIRTTQQDARRTADRKIVLPNNPPRGEPGRMEIPARQGNPTPPPAQPSFPDDFDFDFLLDDLNGWAPYGELTASGKAQVLIKRLTKNRLKVRVVPAIRVCHVTEGERRCLEETDDVPPSFHDRSRSSIVPVLLIHKGGLLGLPEFDVALEVGEPHTIGIVPGDSFAPAMTFPCGTVAYTIVLDGSIDFTKDEQWFPHPAVRAVFRKLTARNNANAEQCAAFYKLAERVGMNWGKQNAEKGLQGKIGDRRNVPSN
jgi:hypothetical protein